MTLETELTLRKFNSQFSIKKLAQDGKIGIYLCKIALFSQYGEQKI